MQIGFIGGDGASVGELHGLAVDAMQIGCMHRRTRRMAARTAERKEQRLALVGEIVALRLRGSPACIVFGRHDHQAAGHSGMVGAAEFRAGEMESARLGGVEPFISVTVRQNVLLQSQCREIEIVNDVLRRHRQPYIGVRRHVQHVDLARAAWVLKAPHPLLGDDVDFQRILWRSECGKLIGGGPPEEKQKREQRRHRPADLDFMALALRHLAARRARTAVVEREKNHDEPGYQRDHQARYNGKQIEQVIDPNRIIGGLGGELVEVHVAALRRSCAIMASTLARTTTSVVPAA